MLHMTDYYRLHDCPEVTYTPTNFIRAPGANYVEYGSWCYTEKGVINLPLDMYSEFS